MSCWNAAIGEADPAVAVEKVSDCLANGSDVVACQSKACDGYAFQYNPVYPVAKPEPDCVNTGYAALKEYVKGCWADAIEEDPATAVQKVNECLEKGSEVAACQSNACGGYSFKYEPVFPTTHSVPTCVSEGYTAL